tara:strand:+ start:325 stop:1212 length:888 start_codon:yes stop_codon:yes gene_type:complete
MNPSPSDLRAGMLALYASIVLLATNGLFSKLIPLDPTTITQIRSVIASVVLITLLVLQGSSFRLVSRREFFGVYGLGVLLCLHWITYFHAMQVSTVAIGMLALFSYPVMTVILEPLLQGRLPKWVDLFAAVAVVFGVFLMVSDEILKGQLDSGSFLGAFWGVISALLFSLRNTLQRHYFSRVNSISLMGHQTLGVAVMLLAFVDWSALGSLGTSGWALVVALGCFSTAGAHTLLSMSLKRLSAKTVGLISCNTPIFGVLFAWLVLGEVPSLMVYVGGAVILLVASWETLKGGKNA